MARIVKTVTPVDGSVYVQRPYAAKSRITAALARAERAQAA